MERYIKAISGISAVVFFFLLALIGWIAGHEPATIATRSFFAAVILYWAVSIAARLVMGIIIHEIVEKKAQQTAAEQEAS